MLFFYGLVVIEDKTLVLSDLKFSDVFKVMNSAFGIDPWDEDMGGKEIVDTVFYFFCSLLF